VQEQPASRPEYRWTLLNDPQGFSHMLPGLWLRPLGHRDERGQDHRRQAVQLVPGAGRVFEDQPRCSIISGSASGSAHGRSTSYDQDMRSPCSDPNDKLDSMARTRNLYVREGRDEDVWRRAEAFAVDHRMSLSILVVTALEEYLSRHEGEDE
jgi:hypothetical protein